LHRKRENAWTFLPAVLFDAIHANGLTALTEWCAGAGIAYESWKPFVDGEELTKDPTLYRLGKKLPHLQHSGWELSGSCAANGYTPELCQFALGAPGAIVGFGHRPEHKHFMSFLSLNRIAA
jgi:hypothetical protein